MSICETANPSFVRQFPQVSLLVLKSQFPQQIDCLVFEKRFGDFVLRLGAGKGRRMSAGKKARYVGRGKHDAGGSSAHIEGGTFFLRFHES